MHIIIDKRDHCILKEYGQFYKIIDTLRVNLLLFNDDSFQVTQSFCNSIRWIILNTLKSSRQTWKRLMTTLIISSTNRSSWDYMTTNCHKSSLKKNLLLWWLLHNLILQFSLQLKEIWTRLNKNHNKKKKYLQFVNVSWRRNKKSYNRKNRKRMNS